MEVLNAIKFWVKKDPELEHWKAQLVAAKKQVELQRMWLENTEKAVSYYHDAFVGGSMGDLSEIMRIYLKCLYDRQMDLARAEATAKGIQGEINRITNCHTDDGWCA